MLTRDAILAALKRYRVQNHYRATRDVGAARYGLWGPGGIIGEPGAHAELAKLRDELIAGDILAAARGE